MKVDGDCTIETDGDLYLKAGGKDRLRSRGWRQLPWNRKFHRRQFVGHCHEGPMVWINCGRTAPPSPERESKDAKASELPGPPPPPSVPPPPTFPTLAGMGAMLGGLAGAAMSSQVSSTTGFTGSSGGGSGGSSGGASQGSGSGAAGTASGSTFGQQLPPGPASAAQQGGAQSFSSGGFVRFVPGSSPQSSPTVAHQATHIVQQGGATPQTPGTQPPGAAPQTGQGNPPTPPPGSKPGSGGKP